MTAISPAALNNLKDLGARVQLPTELHQRIQETLAKSSADKGEAEALRDALDTVEACVAFLDVEIKRLTQERFAIGDAGAVRQRLLGDPRRAVDLALGQFKQRIAGERPEWTRRIAKQVLDIQAQAEAELSNIQVSVTHRGGDLTVAPDKDWTLRYGRWINDVFATWTHHLVELLRAKTVQLIQPDLDALSELLGEPLRVDLPTATALPTPELGASHELSESVETPSLGATVFESFQGGLNAVGMLAGMVVIPVVGQLMHTASTEVRAIAMGGAVTPVLLLAIIRGRATRRRLVEGNAAKATEKLKKTLAVEQKQLVDRFKAEADRACLGYLNQAQGVANAVIEAAVARFFERRERSVAEEQARVQLMSDRLQEQIGAYKMARSGLAGQVVVELKRKLAS